MIDIDPRGLQFFYGTEPQPCPYVAGRAERKAATELTGPGAAALHDTLCRAGFRRSHMLAYRPACPDCRACVPVRVAAADFTPRRSQRRVLARNADLVARERPPRATLEQYFVFRQYQAARHGGEMAAMRFRDYRAMIEESPVDTQVVEFRDSAGRLVAATLVDRLTDGFSGVYKFFAPDRARASPGVHAVLWHIERARTLGLGYVYLGYWIAESRKMAYKTRFQPLEALVDGRWRRFDPRDFAPRAAEKAGRGAGAIPAPERRETFAAPRACRSQPEREALEGRKR